MLSCIALYFLSFLTKSYYPAIQLCVLISIGGHACLLLAHSLELAYQWCFKEYLHTYIHLVPLIMQCVASAS